MPAKNPRLTITLEPQLGAYLRKLSELTGNSQSRLIGELLEDVEPVLVKMIKLLQAAQSASDQVRGRIRSDLEAAHLRIEEQLGFPLTDPEDELLPGPLLVDVEKVARRRRKQPAGAAVPTRAAALPSTETPLSNRGVRSHGESLVSSVRRRS